MTPNHLSLLGIVHTSISILAIIAAFIALAVKGRISPAVGWGRLYTVLTILTCLTALPIMRTGHPTPGHPLAIIILVLLPLAAYARVIRPFKKNADYIQTIIMSFTLFLSFIPATVETLTRLPISHPLAADAAAPLVGMTLLVFFVLFIAGSGYQVAKIKKERKVIAGVDPGIQAS